MPWLWVSSAAEEPISHLVPVIDADDERRERIDPTEDPVAEAEGVFAPILNPSGRFAIYWTGRMAEVRGGGWVMAEGGAPYLSAARVRGDTFAFDNERLLFSDLTIERDAFTSAAITGASTASATRSRRCAGPACRRAMTRTSSIPTRRACTSATRPIRAA